MFTSYYWAARQGWACLEGKTENDSLATLCCHFFKGNKVGFLIKPPEDTCFNCVQAFIIHTGGSLSIE